MLRVLKLSGRVMNWRIKLLIKVISGKIPAVKLALKKMGYLQHGSMQSREYAIAVFNHHLARWNTRLKNGGSAPSDNEAAYDKTVPLKCGKGTCLEIGPGESLITMIIARAAGFEKTYLIDYGWQISADTSLYKEVVSYLRDLGFDIPELDAGDSIDDIMRKYSATYLTSGLDSLRTLESASIDFSFSHAVFEHIPKSQVAGYLRELKRVGKPGGYSSHCIDLRDHLAASIQHLRFAETTWETPLIYQSGVYTNRLRYSQWLGLFEAECIGYRIISQSSFPALPLAKNKLAKEYRELDVPDLLVSGFDVLFRWDNSAS